MLCSNCQTQNPESSQFCMSCGQRLQPPDNATKKLPETGAETVRLPESEPPVYTPPAASSPPAYKPLPPYTPPATPSSTPPNYTPPGYTPPSYTPPGYRPPEKEVVASSQQRLIASRGFKLALGGGVLLLLMLVGGLLAARFLPSLGGKGNEILLAMPQRSGELDLYLVKTGHELDQGVLLVEDAQEPADMNIWFSYVTQEPVYRVNNLSAYGIGGFVPESNRLFYWFADDADIRVVETEIGADAPVEILKTDALPLHALLFPEADTLFLQETRSDQERCYVAGARAAAERITKGDSCWATRYGSHVWVEEKDADELTLSLLPTKGEGDEVTVLDSQAEVQQYAVAQDGSRVVYDQNGRDGWQLFLFAVSDGSTVEIGEPGVNIPQFGFLGETEKVFYLMENDDGVLQLFVSGGAAPVAEGVGLTAVASDDGRYLIYLAADEDGERSVGAYDVNAGTTQTILADDNLKFDLIAAHNVILLQVQDGDDLSIYRADLNGANLELLYDDNLALQRAQYSPDDNHLFILASDDDGYLSLFTTSLNQADGYYVLEDFNDIVLLNRSLDGRSLVLSAQEDPEDDYILYSVSLEKGVAPVELDDQYDRYVNAVFTANGRDILYTGVSGSRPDDVDVLQIAADGEKAAEVLYQEAQLVATRWDSLAPFNFISGYSYLYESVSFCPGAKTLVVGDSRQESLPEEGSVCYRYRGEEGDIVTFDLDSVADEDYDFTLTLHDQEGNSLDYNDDDSSGLDPRLTVQLPARGSYFVIVGGNGRTTTPQYTLAALDGPGEPDLVGASQLAVNAKIRDVIEEADTVFIQRYSALFYGHFYYFDAEANDRLTLDVYASTIGSDLDPEVYLFDQLMEFIASDDDAGDDYDSRLSFTTSYTGRYYILVTSSSSDDYGSNAFYEVELTR